MLFARPVAGFTAYIDLIVAGVEGFALRIVIFAYIGAVALGTAGIPVVIRARPVEGVASANSRLIRVYVIPTLAALLGGPRIPGNTECLKTTAR